MADPWTAQGTEESIQDVLARYEAKGYRGQFGAAADGMVRCHSCHDTTPSDQVPLRAMHRIEGTTDPDDEAVILGLECPSCGAWGTLAVPYGTETTAEDAAVLAHFMDDREHSTIERGL